MIMNVCDYVGHSVGCIQVSSIHLSTFFFIVRYNYDILLYTCQRFFYYNNKICTLCMMPVYQLMILLYLFHSDVLAHVWRISVLCSGALYHNLLWTLNLTGTSLPPYFDSVSTADIMQCQTATVVPHQLICYKLP
jgi:hypothetical protein